MAYEKELPEGADMPPLRGVLYPLEAFGHFFQKPQIRAKGECADDEEKPNY
jgi:hypothetical protein